MPTRSRNSIPDNFAESALACSAINGVRSFCTGWQPWTRLQPYGACSCCVIAFCTFVAVLPVQIFPYVKTGVVCDRKRKGVWQFGWYRQCVSNIQGPLFRQHHTQSVVGQYYAMQRPSMPDNCLRTKSYKPNGALQTWVAFEVSQSFASNFASWTEAVVPRTFIGSFQSAPVKFVSEARCSLFLLQ